MEIGKIKNWSRKQSKETRKTEYRWEHDLQSDVIEVVDLPKGYKVKLLNRGDGKPSKTLRQTTVKEKAREYAVRWMRAHSRV